MAHSSKIETPKSPYHTPVPANNSRVVQYLSLFGCNECNTWKDGTHYVYDPLENVITLFPERRLVHIHFGKPSWNDEITKEESEWVFDITQIGIDIGPHPIFTVCDFSHIDDSEFPTKESIRKYAEAVGREESSHVVSYGGSFAMQMILKMIGSFSTTARKMSFATNHDAAMEQYRAWFEETR